MSARVVDTALQVIPTTGVQFRGRWRGSIAEALLQQSVLEPPEVPAIINGTLAATLRDADTKSRNR